MNKKVSESLRKTLRNIIRQEMLIIKGKESEYQEFFRDTLKKFDVKSPNELSDKRKKEFFDYIDSNYKAKKETD